MNTQEYLNAVRTADITLIARWRTTICPECQMLVHRTEDGEDTAGHTIVNGAIAIGCEGYYVINPARLGELLGICLATEQWEDWTDDDDDHMTCPDHGRVNVTHWSAAGTDCTLTYSCGCERTATPADFEALI